MNTVPQPHLSLSAIVLAGGLSSRMGQDKALLPIAGVPLLTRTCQIAQQIADPVYVVTPWGDRYQSVVDSQVQFIPEVWTSDQPNGSLMGFVQGLAIVQTDWVLLLACDLPKLRVEVLENWAAELSDTGDAIALLPKNPEGWWEPLCGFYRRDCLVSLEAYGEEGGRSFQRWIEQQGEKVRELEVSDPGSNGEAARQMLLNCNTPEDLFLNNSL
jgi:molybdenum cofactor guanylyltransferase